jgi:hypothetical protein
MMWNFRELDLTFQMSENDASTKRPAEKIAKDYEMLLHEAIPRAIGVTISSIPPRKDDPLIMEKIDEVNVYLSNFANRTSGVTFVNNDRNFRYQDSSIDSTMLLQGDMLHLSAKGTSKLLENLGLSGMAKAATGNGPKNRWTQRQNDGTHAPPGVSGNVRPQPPTPPTTRSIPPHHQTAPPTSYPAPGSSIPQQPSPQLGQPPRSWPGIKGMPHLKNKRYFHSAVDPLSNFYLTNITMWNQVFKSSEHAYQWRKAMFLGNENAAYF